MHIHLECNLRSFEYADLNVPHLLPWHCSGLASKSPTHYGSGVRGQIYVLVIFFNQFPKGWY